MADETPRSVPSSSRMVIRLTGRAYAEQHGLSVRDVIEAINKFGPEAELGEGAGGVTYALEDLHAALADHFESARLRAQDSEMEFFRRILPEIRSGIVEAVREVVKSELGLATMIRDTKETMIVDVLGAQRAMVRDAKVAISFLTRVASQINLAAVAGVVSTVPTAGVHGAKESLGVETPLPVGLGLPLAGIHQDRRSTAPPPATTTLSGGPPPAKDKGRQPLSNPKLSGEGVSTSPAEKSSTPSDGDGCGSPIFHSMMPAKGVSDAARTVILKHDALIEELLQMSDLDLARLNTDEVSAIDEILAPWEARISDIPKFSSFFGSFSMIQSWVAQRTPDVPLLVIFLALNSRVPGCISASDFMDMCGV